MPKWATPERKAHLVRLFQDSGGFCVFGHKPCHNPEHHHYEPFIEGLIKDWVKDDREGRAYELKLEQRRLHGLDERGPIRGRFNAIARDIFHDRQPQSYLEALGMSGLTFTPFAKVRFASSNTRLHVDLGDTLRGVSKNKRRKAIRYGRIPAEVQERVDALVTKAIRDFMR